MHTQSTPEISSHHHFAQTGQTENILISRKNLDKALFVGKHYRFDLGSGEQVFNTASIDIAVTAPRAVCHRPRFQKAKDVTVRCSLLDTQNNQIIDLEFTQAGVTDLKFKKGEIKDGHTKMVKPIVNATQLTDALTTIYRAVRSEVEPQHKQNLQGDMMMAPEFAIMPQGKTSVIQFKPVKPETKPACQNNCPGCKRFNFL